MALSLQKILTILQFLNENVKILLDLINTNLRKNSNSNRSQLVRPINQLRLEKGFFNLFFDELKKDSVMFFRYTRMDVPTFYNLLNLVKPYLRKRQRKNVISPEERLLLTIRYLASGDEILSLALQHRMGETTARNIIYEVCRVLYNTLSVIYLRPPVKPAWRNISNGFEKNWNMPNCLGAVDGKHFKIRAPPDSGSSFFNYKQTYSIVLLAACNHRYEFTIVEVGAFGGESDGGVFARSEFGKRFNQGQLDIPMEKRQLLPNSNIKIPYYFVGDEAYQLKSNFMRPYPGRNLDRKKKIFNYRLSRARRCIENAFGILASRWRIFERPIACLPKHVDNIIKAAICLHNFLMAQTQKSVRNLYCSPSYIDQLNENYENEVNECDRVNVQNSRLSTREAINIRDSLADYFVSPEGEVPWQDEYISRGLYGELRQE